MITDLLQEAVPSWLKGSKDTIILSSRVRLARNFEELSFPSREVEEDLAEVETRMRFLMKTFSEIEKEVFSYAQLSQFSERERAVLVEKHYISPALAGSHSHRGFLFNEAGDISIMVNEEDHLRIQVMEAGLSLQACYERAIRLDDVIEAKYPYAFRDSLGYLTSCPTNVGTGLRASVMLHLPALMLTGSMNRMVQSIQKYGFTVRGLYGEGSETTGNVFQISNQITMGVKEQECIEELERIVHEVVKAEERKRRELLERSGDALEDRAKRAYGILANAKLLNGNEALTYLSEMQLGCDLGFFPKKFSNIFIELLLSTRSNSMQELVGRELDATERDRLRAQIVQDRFNSMSA